MAVYPSRFIGEQIDDVIGLFNQKGLSGVVGIIKRNENGNFSIADLSWAADKSEVVSGITYDSTNKKLIQTIDETDSDVVSVATLMADFGVGEANGIVPLNSSSKIDSIFLPSYVDDVLEFDGLSNFPETGEAGKIYVDTATNKTYRWSGSIYVEISPGTVVTVNRELVSGVKSATITINDTSYDLYAPAATVVPTNISAFVNDSGYITGYTETDPVFSASPAAGITNTDISNWNGKSSFSGNYNDLTNKPTIPIINLNGSSTTSASFYAPTSAGTSGYVLVSSGSGAPTWASIPAGATVTLNGIVSATPSFYAPTTAGTSGQVLTSNGSGAPTWAAAPSGGDIFVAEYGVTTFDEIKAAYEAGKYIILKVSQTFEDSEGAYTIDSYLNFISLNNQLEDSNAPYASVMFSNSENGNVLGYLVSCECFVSEDPENPGDLIEEWALETLEVQSRLVSGTNIKTINNQSILGSGNLTISSGSSTQIVTWTEV